MPRPADKMQEIYDFLLEHFKRIHYANLSKKFSRNLTNRFPSQESIIAFVYKSPKYVNSNSYSQDTLQPDVKSVSSNTIRKAIAKLIIDGKIEQTDEGFKYIPQYDDQLRMHPIVEISSQVPIHIGVPENILVLTVGNGMATSVAEYLSAQFYNEDIIFLPIGKHILCISIMPFSVLDDPIKQALPSHSHLLFRKRIELILHQFQLNYRDFPYASFYETDYLVKYHPDIKKDLLRLAKHLPGSPIENYTWLTRTLTWNRSELLATEYGDLLIDDEEEEAETADESTCT